MHVVVRCVVVCAASAWVWTTSVCGRRPPWQQQTRWRSSSASLTSRWVTVEEGEGRGLLRATSIGCVACVTEADTSAALSGVCKRQHWLQWRLVASKLVLKDHNPCCCSASLQIVMVTEQISYEEKRELAKQLADKQVRFRSCTVPSLVMASNQARHWVAI